MATSLAEIRAKLAAQETRNRNTNAPRVSPVYPHWNIEEKTTARIRFLPDADPNNTFFWVERQLINLPFNGIKGQVDSRPLTVQVPCIEMYGADQRCPILAQVRPWYNDESLKTLAGKYWKKRSYLFQGFVRENPIESDITPENPIRQFVINGQIFNIIKSSLTDPELENLPTDYENGLDFQILKTINGPYNDFNTSKWARRESALTEAELEAIAKHGLINLADLLPKKPTETELKIMVEMFEASVDGQPYDEEAWGPYFKPRGSYDSNTTTTTTSTAKATTASATEDNEDFAPVTRTVAVKEESESEDIPFDADPVQEPVREVKTVAAPATQASSSSRAEDILAKIKARQANS